MIESSFVIILPFDKFTFLPLSIPEVLLSFDNAYIDLPHVAVITTSEPETISFAFDTNLYSLDMEGISGVTGTSGVSSPVGISGVVGVSPPDTCPSPHISSINPGASMNGFLLPW